MKRHFKRSPTYQGSRWNYLYIVGIGFPDLFVVNATTAHIGNLTTYKWQILSTHVQQMTKIKKWEI